MVSEAPEVTREASVRGEGCRLRLTVSAYEFPDLGDIDDGNWLIGTVELEASVSGEFRGFHRVTIRADELAQFRDELRPIVDTSNGEATLLHMEEQFGGTVALRDGKGELTAFVREHIGSTLRVEQCQTDQSYLAETLRELDSLLGEFPVRGT